MWTGVTGGREVDGVKAIHRTADMCWSGLIQSGHTPCILQINDEGC